MVDTIFQYLNYDEKSDEEGFRIVKNMFTFKNSDPINRCIETISRTFIPLVHSNNKKFTYIIEPKCIFNNLYGMNKTNYYNLTTSTNQYLINLTYSLRNIDQDTRNFLYSINRYDEYIIKYISDNSENIFGKKLSIEECEKHYNSIVQYSNKYPQTISFDISPDELINLKVIKNENNEIHTIEDIEHLLSKRCSNFKLEFKIHGLYIENIEDVENFTCQLKVNIVKITQQVNTLDKFSLPSELDDSD